jgi:antitoxin MazE
MQTKIQKWGNSLALRIPKAFAAQMGMKSDTKVTIVLEEDHIAILKPDPPTVSLDSLLAGITPKNIHREVDTGAAKGKEVW